MGQYELFDRILASLHEATLDDSHWPVIAGLIVDASDLAHNLLLSAARAKPPPGLALH